MGSWSLGGKARIGTAFSVIAATAPIAILTSGGYMGLQQLTQILALLAGWGLCIAITLLMESFRDSGRGAPEGLQLPARQ